MSWQNCSLNRNRNRPSLILAFLSLELILMILIERLSYLAFANGVAVNNDEKKYSPPHIFFVLIDDLGWGNIGYHVKSTSPQRKQEVQTPVMDRLAKQEGIELNRHYVHHSCTGTRTSLQSGRLPVHVQTTLKNPEDPSSGMPRNMTGLAEHLKKNNTYATHYVGKWDVGMATPKHTPKGRGYDTSLNYFEHKNDYWDQSCLQSVCCHKLIHEENYSHGNENLISEMKKNETIIYDFWDTDRPARNLRGTDFEEFIFQERMLKIIDQHAMTNKQSGVQQPLFLFYAPHVAHCPLQVPENYLRQFDFMDNDEDMCKAQTKSIIGPNDIPKKYSCRKQYHAMVKLLDDVLGNVVERLKYHKMWENTLMVVTSDNGGPVNPEESAATNYPLRGGKYSDWEGGVRAVAFVSGEFIPIDRRGKVVEEPIHITDWYATLPALAGIDVQGDLKSRSFNEGRYIPIDAVNVWPLISGETENSPRNEIPLSEQALIVGKYKLLWNQKKNVTISGYTYPNYPNSMSEKHEIYDKLVDCSHGCLYNVELDPGEHHDIAFSNQLRVQRMKARLKELRSTFFDNDDRGIDSCPKGYNNDDKDLKCACWMALNFYGGFLGPYQEVDLGVAEDYSWDLHNGEDSIY